MPRIVRPIVLIVVLALAAGACRRQPPATEVVPSLAGSADLELLPAPEPPPPRPAERPRPARPEIAITTLSQELPEYPAAALEDRVTCTARLLYHIQTDGSADLIRLEWDAAPPEQHVAAFEASIDRTVETWKFVPAIRLIPRQASDGGQTYESKVIPKAGRALIRFRVEEGKPVVE